jgi:hypothetical protein
MPAFYDAKPLTINFKELPSAGEAAVLAHNASKNIIYMSDAGIVGGEMFISVLNAIQGEGKGFNPLWQEAQLNGTNCPTTPQDCPVPTQFTSDNDVLAAAAAGTISITMTTEVYRCSVVGPGPKAPASE